jgi:uncharacterized protein involved in exopolysaccharide biosynthesis
VKRYITTFYRRKWFYLFVLVVMLGMTGAGASYFSSGYESTGRIWVDRPTIARALDPYQIYYTTPAEEHSNMLYALFQTDSFIRLTLEGTALESELTGAPSEDRAIISAVRQNLWQRSLGPNTIEVTFLSDDPVLSQQVVANAIQGFREWEVNIRSEEATAEIQLYEEQLEAQGMRVQEARQRLDAFMAENPDPEPGTAASLELQWLRREYETASVRHQEITNHLAEVRMINALSSVYGTSEFRVLDEPQVPESESASLQRQVTWLVPGVLASFALIGGAVVLATWQDRSVHSAEDLARITSVPVIGLMPHIDTKNQGLIAQPEPGAQAASRARLADRPAD